jgi:hypothetical protein
VQYVTVADAPADEVAFITSSIPEQALTEKAAALTGMTLTRSLRFF